MELFAADGHDAGGCERVTGKSGMRPAKRWRFEYPHVARILERMAGGHDSGARWMESWAQARMRLEH